MSRYYTFIAAAVILLLQVPDGAARCKGTPLPISKTSSMRRTE
jgi:hypothetical protein